MATISLADIDQILKTLYKDKVPEVGHKPPVLWSMLRKNTSFKGRNTSISTQYSRTKGRSRQFGAARANSGNSDFVEFLVTRAQDYAVIQIQTETLEAARDAGAKLNYLRRESRSGMDKLKHNANRAAYRNTGGALSRILAVGGGGGTATITVQEPTDLVFLDVGDTLTGSPDDGTTGTDGTNPTVVTAIDRVAGTITTSATWDAVDFADDNYIFVEGDFGLAFAGLAAWVPEVAPVVGSSFFNVDRGVDPLRLGGMRIVAEPGDGTIEAFLKRAITEHGIQGGMADVAMVNPIVWDLLSEELGNKVRYAKQPARTSAGEDKAFAGFEGIVISADSRQVKVIADRDCPKDTSYLLDLDHFWWEGLGETPRYIEHGNFSGWLQMDDEDAMEGRMVCRGNFVSDAPGKLATLDMTEVTT